MITDHNTQPSLAVLGDFLEVMARSIDSFLGSIRIIERTLSPFQWNVPLFEHLSAVGAEMHGQCLPLRERGLRRIHAW